MKKKLVVATLMAVCTSAAAAPMSVNVSGPGAVSPFTGYRMTYTDKDRNSCTFLFNLPGDGMAYLTADKECPSFVTDRRVFMDAQKALERMEIVSTAITFAEFYGDDGHGNKVEKAELLYRCANTNKITVSNPIEWAGIKRTHMHGFVFMPISDIHIDGWYELDLAGYKTYKTKVGAWRLDKNGMITGSYMGRLFTIPDIETSKCQYRRSH